MLRPMTTSSLLPASIAAVQSLQVTSEAIDLDCAYAESMEEFAANAPAHFVNFSSIQTRKYEDPEIERQAQKLDNREIEYKNLFERQFSALRPKKVLTVKLGFAARQAELRKRKDGIEELMTKARDARNVRNFEIAERYYRLAAYDLQTPVDNSPFSKPMYMHLVEESGEGRKLIGPSLLTEAILESANTSDVNYAAQNIHHLNYLLAHPPAEGFSAADRLKAEILRAKSIAAHASGAIHSKIDSLEHAHSLLHEIFYGIDPEEDQAHRELHLFAGTSLVELAAQLFYFAHNRGDRKAGDNRNASDSIDDDGSSEMPKTYVEALQKYLNRLQDVHCPSDIDETIKRIERDGEDPDVARELVNGLNANRNLIASYRSAIARLFASQEHWYSALSMARTLTSEPLDDTSAARALLQTDIFNRFTDGLQFLEPGEIPKSQKDGWFGAWLQQVLHNANSSGFVQSATAGSIGLILGFLGDKILTGGEHGFVAATLCASGAYLLNLLRNGCSSEQAKVAGNLGILERDGDGIKSDLLRFGAKVIKSGIWIVPAAICAFFPELCSKFGDMMALYGTEYINQAGNFAAGVQSHAESIVGTFSPEGIKESMEYLKFIVDGSVDVDWGAVANIPLGLYGAASAAYFTLYTFSSNFRENLGKTWLPVILTPAAMMCAASIGMAIQYAGCPDTWIERFVRTVPILIGSMLVMLNSGISSVVRSKKEGEKESRFKTFLKSFDPEKIDYSLIPVMIITFGGTTALGGNIQHVLGDPQSTLDLITWGAAMPVGALPITLLLSGVLKKKIPLRARINEAIEDTKGMGFWKSAYEKIMSFGSAVFSSSYSTNRLLRTVVDDPPSAIARFALGWDTLAGVSVQKVMDLAMGDGASTAKWNETSNTWWERSPLLLVLHNMALDIKEIRKEMDEGKISREAANERIHEIMKEMRNKAKVSGQSMHPAHLAMDHKRPRDFFWPAYSFLRAFYRPKFSHVANTHFYLNVYQLLMDSHTDLHDAGELKPVKESRWAGVAKYFHWNRGSSKAYRYVRGKFKKESKASEAEKMKDEDMNSRDSRQRLTEEEFEAILDFVRVEAAKPVSHDRIRPMVGTLILARESERFGKKIESFLAANPWILDVLNMDVEELERVRGSSFMGDMMWRASRALSRRFPKVMVTLRKLGSVMRGKSPDIAYLFSKLAPKVGKGRHPIRRIDHKHFRRAIKTSFDKYERRIKSDRRQPDETKLLGELFAIDPFDTAAPNHEIRPVKIGAPPPPHISEAQIQELHSALDDYKDVKFL
jgi:hypothetical protein